MNKLMENEIVPLFQIHKPETETTELSFIGQM